MKNKDVEKLVEIVHNAENILSEIFHQLRLKKKMLFEFLSKVMVNVLKFND